MTPAEAAQRLNTRVDVVSALEAGDFSRLPAWPETVRVVTSFTGLAHIDALPVLSLIYMSMAQPEASARERPRTSQKEKTPEPTRDPSETLSAFKFAVVQPVADAVSAARNALAVFSIEQAVGIMERGATSILVAMRRNARRTAALVAVSFALVAYFGQGSSLQASLATLQPPIAKLMRSAQDYLLERAAPVRDGFRWIEVDDPSSRRTDRLTPRHP